MVFNSNNNQQNTQNPISTTCNLNKCMTCIKKYNCSKYLCLLIESKCFTNSTEENTELLDEIKNINSVINNNFSNFQNENNQGLQSLNIFLESQLENKFNENTISMNNFIKNMYDINNNLNVKLDYLISSIGIKYNKLPILNNISENTNENFVLYEIDDDIKNKNIENKFKLKFNSKSSSGYLNVKIKSGENIYNLLYESEPLLNEFIIVDKYYICEIKNNDIIFDLEIPLANEKEVVFESLDSSNNNASLAVTPKKTFVEKKNLFGKPTGKFKEVIISD